MTLRVNQLTGFGAGRKIPGTPFHTSFVDLSLDTDLILCLDAGDAASYDTGVDSQIFFDVTSNNTDFHLGNDGTVEDDDPVFHGAIGGLSSSEFFTFDGSGGDAQFTTVSGATPANMQPFHKNNATLTLAGWLRLVPNSTTQSILQNRALFGEGLRWRLDNANEMRFGITNDSNASAFNVQADTTITNIDAFLAVSIDEAAGGGGSFFYKDGAYDQVSASDTFDATYSAPSVDDTTGDVTIGSASTIAANTRLYGLMVWDAALTKANLDAIYNATKGRFGL